MSDTKNANPAHNLDLFRVDPSAPLGPAMMSDEQMVWFLLRRCRGRDHAIPVPELAAKTGILEVSVRAIVKGLIEEHHKLIGSATSPPAGFFVIETREELRAVCDSLKGRALSILYRMSVLKRCGIRRLLKDLELELGDAQNRT